MATTSRPAEEPIADMVPDGTQMANRTPAVRGVAGTVCTVQPALFDLPDPDPDPVVLVDPVGSVVDTAAGAWGVGTATFDETRTWRYRLSRVWGGGLRVNFVMLNPSTADAFTLDPTVRRCVGYAMAWGAGALEVTNAYALRSTDPKGLIEVDDPVGPGNDTAIVAAAQAADLVIAGWGVHGTHLDREQQMRELLAAAGIAVHVLGFTKDGHPRHPLYLPATAEPVVWT